MRPDVFGFSCPVKKTSSDKFHFGPVMANTSRAFFLDRMLWDGQ